MSDGCHPKEAYHERIAHMIYDELKKCRQNVEKCRRVIVGM